MKKSAFDQRGQKNNQGKGQPVPDFQEKEGVIKPGLGFGELVQPG
jgi:hypothetical protein